MARRSPRAGRDAAPGRRRVRRSAAGRSRPRCRCRPLRRSAPGAPGRAARRALRAASGRRRGRRGPRSPRGAGTQVWRRRVDGRMAGARTSRYGPRFDGLRWTPCPAGTADVLVAGPYLTAGQHSGPPPVDNPPATGRLYLPVSVRGVRAVRSDGGLLQPSALALRTDRPRRRTARRWRARTPGTRSALQASSRPSWPRGWSRPSREEGLGVGLGAQRALLPASSSSASSTSSCCTSSVMCAPRLSFASP